MKVPSAIRYVLAVVTFLTAAACANPGSGPDGGPYDERPPRIVAMTPPLGEQTSKTTKVKIVFDENIKIDNPQENVIVSPPQIEMPEISASGKHITVTLLDTLKPNTTYTIDFGDAISDNNEGNPLGNFTYFFSTGEEVDSMEISGHVLNAEDLAPLKGVLVGLYTDETDSAFTSRPFDRVARTDAEGHFTIKGISHGSYRLYALKDIDGDYLFSTRAEAVGWTDSLLTTSSFADIRHDTLWRDTIVYDTILTVPFTHYMPDDVVILAFQHPNVPRHFIKAQRDMPALFTTYFTGPSDSAPTYRGLNFDATDAFVETRSRGNDTITYWLRDTALCRLDTLQLLYSYYETDDSLGTDTLRTDTLAVVSKLTQARIDKNKAEELADFKKKLEKRHKRGDFSNETPPREFLKTEIKCGSKISPLDKILLTFNEPLLRLDTAGIHLRLGPDSTAVDAYYELLPTGTDSQSFTLLGEWRPGQQYTVVIDSASAEGLSRLHNDKVRRRFSVAKEDDYGALFVSLPGMDSTTIVQVMQNEKHILASQRAHGGRADFYYLKPGRVFLRLFTDSNGDGQWTPGLIEERRQPERVCYYPQAIELRANWDTDITWQPDEVPILRQKPAGLTKTSAKTKKSNAHQRNIDRLKEKGK